MTVTDKRVAALAIAGALASAPLHAQMGQGATAAGRAAARTIATRTTTSAARAASALTQLGSGSSVASSRVTAVMGYLWAGEGTPVSNATVQLRNIVTGQIEQVSTTMQNGAFAFQNVSSGTYAIEYVTESAGRVMAIGQAFSVAPGETVATFVRLGGEIAGIATGVASNAAQAVVTQATQAAASGVISVAGTAAPEQPASALR